MWYIKDMDLKLLAQNIGQQEARLRRLEAAIQEIIKQINEWAKSIDGIDQVAFLAMYNQVNDVSMEAEITKDRVKATHAAIEDGFNRLEEYRDRVVAEAKKDGNKKTQKNN